MAGAGVEVVLVIVVGLEGGVGEGVGVCAGVRG